MQRPMGDGIEGIDLPTKERLKDANETMRKMERVGYACRCRKREECVNL